MRYLIPFFSRQQKCAAQAADTLADAPTPGQRQITPREAEYRTIAASSSLNYRAPLHKPRPHDATMRMARSRAALSRASPGQGRLILATASRPAGASAAL